jgi:hypothetical protein
MKKWTVILVSLALVSGVVAFGQEHPKTKPVPPVSRTPVFMGIVDKVTPADPATGKKPEIVVIHKPTNKSLTFVVTDTCTIYDAKGTAITLDKIVKGSEVNVKYKTGPQGIHDAVSVKLVK